MITKIDKILSELSFRVSDGMPDLTNEQHLIKLFDVLKDFGWPVKERVEFLQSINEYYWDNWSEKEKAQYIAKHGAPPTPRGGAADTTTTKKDKKEKPKKKRERTPEEQGLVDAQEKTSYKRDKGKAGAGGQVASQGESRFCGAVDNLDYDDFNTKNRKEIDKEIEGLDTRKPKYPSKKEVRDLEAIGLDPNSAKGKEYIASREVWSRQELERIKKEPKPNVFSNTDGFGGNKKPRPEEPTLSDPPTKKELAAHKKWEKKAEAWDKKEAVADEAYKEWMRAAYDGALATQEHLEESRMDTSQPHQTIQSTKKIDNEVESGLKDKRDESEKLLIECHENTPKKNWKTKCSDVQENFDYYKKELKSFRKFRKYHDTYVVGVDEKGRTFIVSISNKKDSGMNDPQANTTPAARFEAMKATHGKKVAKEVTTAIDDGIKKVTTVKEETRKSSTKVEIDDDFAELAEAASPKRMRDMDERATRVDEETGKAPRYSSGKPKKGAEFACYLEDSGISVEDYNKLSRAEKLKHMQKFMGDDDWHTENGTEVAYDPYSKIFIKVGEAMKGSRGFGKSFWEKNPKAAKARKSNGAKQSEKIKQAEANAVNEAHQNVVDTVTEGDKKDGFPDKDGNNGPRTQAYIGTVMEAMHFDTYIDMEDDDDDKVLIQMGINGAKASHIRSCLADKSGYKMPPGDREGLKKHLRSKTSVEVDEEGKTTGAIIITSSDGKTKTRIADDTWRTAGTSQKVASGFGSDMKDCVKGKVAADRGGI